MIRPHHIGKGADIAVKRKLPKPKDLTKSSPDRDHPLVSFPLGFPVCCNDGRRRQIPPLGQIVIDKVLCQKLTDILAIVIARIRPNIIDQESHHPRSMHVEPRPRGPSTPFPCAKDFIRPCRKQENRTQCPNKSLGFCGRQEQGRVDIPYTPGIVTGGAEIGLLENGHDGSRDEIPAFIKMKRNDGLNVQHILHPMVGLQSKIHVVLKRNTDEICNGILCFLGQFGFPFAPSDGSQRELDAR